MAQGEWKSGFPWLRPSFWAFLGTLAAVEFARGALFISILPTYITTQLGYGVAVSGLVLSAHYLADTLFKSPLGWLVDRYGGRRILSLALPWVLFSVFLLQSGHSPWLLVLAAGLYGLAAAPTWPSVVGTLIELSPPEERGGIMGAVNMAWLMGSGLGTILVNFLISSTFQRAFWAVEAVLALGLLLALGLRLRQRRSSRHHQVDHPSLRQQLDRIWKHLASIRALLPGMFVQTLSIGMLLPVLAPYARLQLGLTQAHYAYLLLAGGGVTVLLLVPFGRLADRWSYRGFLTLGFALAALSLLLLVDVEKVVWVYALVCLLGAAYAMILPSWNAVLTRTLPSTVRGTLIGFFMSVEGLGVASGPVLGAKLWEILGPQVPFHASAAVLAVMAVFYLLYPLPGLGAGAS
ncbi:MAG: MFS transporter [Bacillota bacterium]|nr:MFS transporter [Bacillota bacterium]